MDRASISVLILGIFLLWVVVIILGLVPTPFTPTLVKDVDIDRVEISLYDTNNDGVYDNDDVAIIRLFATGEEVDGVAQIKLNSPAVLIFEDNDNTNDADLLGDLDTTIDPDFATDISVTTIDIQLYLEAIVNSTGAPQIWGSGTWRDWL